MAGEGMDTGVDAVSRQELAKLQQDLAQAATSFNAMKAQIATLEAQLQATSVREPPKSTAHANKPLPFRGHGATMHLSSWIFTLRKYLEATNTDPSRWVALGSTYLAESAAVWYEHRDSALHISGVVDTWDAFCQDLITTFQPITAHAMARDKLHSLYQRESVQQYNSIFLKTITLVHNMTEDEKVDKYTHGLKPLFKREVLMENCTSLTHAMQVASKSEMVYARTRRETPNGFDRRPYDNHNRYSAYRNYQDTAVPMEVNNISNGYRRNVGKYQGQQPAHNQSPYVATRKNPITGETYRVTNKYQNNNSNINNDRVPNSSNNWRTSGNGQPRRQ
jgi:Ty3 transposon capsid-like protein